MPRYRRVQDIEHPIGPSGSLTLSVVSADVRLTATTGGTAHVRATFDVGAGSDAEAEEVFHASQLRAHALSGSLAVEEPNTHSLGGAISRLLGGRSVDLASVEVEAPAGCRLEVRVVNSDVRATGFTGTQRFQSVSGDLRLVETQGGLDIDSVSGDVSLRAVASVALKVTNVSGDLSAEAPAYERLRIQSVSGDVSLDGALSGDDPHAFDTVSGDVRLASGSGMTVSVRGMSSDITSSLPHRLEGSGDRRRLIVGDGTATVAFNSMSGDLTVTRSKQAAAAIPTPTEDRLAILGALERGEIDVDEAIRRLGPG